MLKRIFTAPCPLWLVLFLALVTSTSAAGIVAYAAGGFVAQGSTYGPTFATVNGPISATGATLTGLAASQCVQTNAGDVLTSSGGACGGATTVTAPITNSGTAQSPNIGLSTPLGISFGGLGLATATTGCLGYSGAAYNHGNCLDATNPPLSFIGTTLSCTSCVTNVTGTSPLISSGGTTPAISCLTCAVLSTTNNNFTNSNTFGGPAVFNNTVNFGQNTVAACAIGSPNASVCFGSPSQTIAWVVGKTTGVWGGTTASPSAQGCFVSNSGTADNSSCIQFDNNRILSVGAPGPVGSGVSTLQIYGVTDIIKGDAELDGRLDEHSANQIAGKCTMAAGTTCTVTLGVTYTTPVCIATQQSTSTVIAAECSVSGTTATITAASSNSATWGVLVVGDPT